MKKVLITGGAGFIGSNFVRHALQVHPDWEVIVLDKLTYAGNLENLEDVASSPQYRFVRGDICDVKAVDEVAQDCSALINFAAETHVDRSLLEPGAFITTDVYGTYVLLEAAKKYGMERFVQISTDEVYGSIARGSFKEEDPLGPRSPYSASKAGGELMAKAYYESHGVPVIITRGSNNFGPYQYPEKLVPLFITNALEDQALPLYGDGMQVRDWIFVLDHCEGIDYVFEHGEPGETYNLGGGNELPNLEITRMILELLNKPRTLMQHVTDRPGHDRRYSIDCSKIHRLGWQPRYQFETALEQTLQWYCEHQDWWRKIKSGEFWEYYKQNYAHKMRDL